MAFTGLKGKLLLIHSLTIKLGKRIGSATKRRIHGSIHLIDTRCHRLPFLRHLNPHNNNDTVFDASTSYESPAIGRRVTTAVGGWRLAVGGGGGGGGGVKG